MIKESVTPQDVVDLLNEVARIDLGLVQMLVDDTLLCSSELANHPTIQVRDEISGGYSCGLLGILNGLFGTDTNGRGIIQSHYKMKGGQERLVGFSVVKDD